MKKILFRLFLSVFLIAAANAAAKTKVDIRPDGLYLTDVTVAQLEKQYELYGYKDYIYMPDWVYPPSFLPICRLTLTGFPTPTGATNCSCRLSARWR